MKTTNLFPVLLLAAAAALLPLGLKASDNSGGADGNATRGGDGGAGGDGAALRPPEISDEKLAAFEKSLTPEQRKMLDDLQRCILQPEWNRNADAIKKRMAAAGFKVETLDDLVKLDRRDTMAWIAARSPADAQEFWKQLPAQLKEARLRANPAYVDESDRKAAGALPAEALKEAENLLSADVDVYLSARRSAINRGPAILALLSEKLKGLPPDDTRRIRLISAMKEIHAQKAEARENMIRITEAGLRRLDALKAARPATSTSRFALLVSRRVIGASGPFETPVYASMCYFSFPKAANGYEGEVSLMYDNGGIQDELSGVMYGGQQNRIKDLGPVDFDKVASVPNAATTAAWKKDGVATVADHVYLEHCLEPNVGLNKTYKFKVVEVTSSRFAILEWQEIPQDK